jgi:hypothetical protein
MIHNKPKEGKMKYTVADMDKRFTLVTDSQEIEEILSSVAPQFDSSDFGCLFVEVLDGEYGEVFGHEGVTPKLTDRVWKLPY